MNCSNAKHTIRLDLTEEEHQRLVAQINQQHCTQKNFILTKLLDDSLGGKLLSDRIMQIMPEFYNLVSEIGELPIRKELEDFGGKLCRFLK